MHRRSFLLGTAGAAALPLGAPALAQPAGSRVLKFIPQADLRILDPIDPAEVDYSHKRLSALVRERMQEEQDRIRGRAPAEPRAA